MCFEVELFLCVPSYTYNCLHCYIFVSTVSDPSPSVLSNKYPSQPLSSLLKIPVTFLIFSLFI